MTASGDMNGVNQSVHRAAEPGVRIEQHGALAVITLDRPRALNALDDAMRARIAGVLPGYMRAPDIYAVAFCSTGDKAFCAGGDVRELSALARRDLAAARRSLADEYRLNWQLDCFNKPSVSLMNGMCIGSGVGLTLYNTHRVAGEKYSFSMPETGIGLFPDLGVCRTLARLPDEIGLYLGMTGRFIQRADAYALGLVTHCIPAAQFPAVLAALSDAEPVDPLLDGLHKDPGPPEIDTHRSTIRDVFSYESVEEIMQAAREKAKTSSPSASFAASVLEDLQGRCPTSLKITLKHIRQSRSASLKATLEMDHRIASHCLAASDFHAGVHAVLIEKGSRPKWQPARVEDVADEAVARCFNSFGCEDLHLPSREDMQ
jgi:enoyl-CoA hydratase